MDDPEATRPPELSFGPDEKDQCIVPNDEFEAAKERARLAIIEIMEAAETEERAREIDEVRPF